MQFNCERDLAREIERTWQLKALGYGSLVNEGHGLRIQEHLSHGLSRGTSEALTLCYLRTHLGLLLLH